MLCGRFHRDAREQDKSPVPILGIAVLRIFRLFLLASWGLCLGGILVVSLIPLPPLPPNTDKPLHALVFAGVSALTFVAFGRGKSVLIALGVVVVVGLVSEAGQIWVPGRYASLLDLLANMVGIVLGIPLGRIAAARMRRVLLSYKRSK